MASPPSPPPSGPSPPPPAASPANSDDSELCDLSFDYVEDSDGNIVRLSKGGRSSSTPTTPDDKSSEGLRLPSPLPIPPRRSSLSRSESFNPQNAPQPNPQTRPFVRVASVPASLTPGLRAVRPLARRVTAEDRDINHDSRPSAASRIPAIDEHQQEEKENLASVARPASFPLAADLQDEFSYVVSASTPGPPSAKPQGPSRVLVRTRLDANAASARSQSAGLQRSQSQTQRPVQRSAATRSNSSSFAKVESLKPAEPLEIDTDLEDDRPPNYEDIAGRPRGDGSLSQSGSTRPRRSASLTHAPANEDDGHMYYQSNPSQPSSRPTTSLGFSTPNDGPRRVMMDERDKQNYRREADDAERRAQLQAQAHADEIQREQRHAQYQHPRQSPSPTSQPYSQRSQFPAHRRRDSDTLRSVPHPPLNGLSGSPSAPNPPVARLSPSARSMQAVPSTASGSIAPLVPAKHRRSGTAPEQQTTSGMLTPASAPAASLVRTWSGDREGVEWDGQPKEREPVRERAKPQIVQQPQQQVQQQQQQMQMAPPLVPGSRSFIVNRKGYARLDMIGKGGSSRVFRVLSQTNELFAIKRVSLDKTDAETMNGYMNEIALLKRLDGNSRIIRLIDSEVKPGSGGSKGHLFLVMECGEIDLARLISEQMKEPLNMVWVAYYWQQMLQAVHVIHEEKIVHSDLKPANFVLVRGQLKLIDFGIANAIANDTTNIQRDHQVGTVNYMSPEAIELPDGMRRLKVGRASDVWSLGCILYQMVYGHPPFQHLSVYQKMKAIPDSDYEISFPEYATPTVPAPPRQGSSGHGPTTPPKKLDHLKSRVRGDVITSIQSCLRRNAKERALIPELLQQSWLATQEPEAPSAKNLLGEKETIINPYYMVQLLKYGIKLGLDPSSANMSEEMVQKQAEHLVAELKSIQNQ